MEVGAMGRAPLEMVVAVREVAEEALLLKVET